jgi:Holliday junction resolvase RusA-like endonuclease
LNENNNRAGVPSPDLEPDPDNETQGANEVKTFTSRVDVTFHSFRYRLADPDNLSGKAILDECVKAGILSDDSTKEIRAVNHTQEKIGKDQEEKTILTIEEIEDASKEKQAAVDGG